MQHNNGNLKVNVSHSSLLATKTFRAMHHLNDRLVVLSISSLSSPKFSKHNKIQTLTVKMQCAHILAIQHRKKKIYLFDDVEI